MEGILKGGEVHGEIGIPARARKFQRVSDFRKVLPRHPINKALVREDWTYSVLSRVPRPILQNLRCLTARQESNLAKL